MDSTLKTSFTCINWHKIILRSKFSTSPPFHSYGYRCIFWTFTLLGMLRTTNLRSTCTEHFPLKTNYPCQHIMLLLCMPNTHTRPHNNNNKKCNTQNEKENVPITKWQLVYNFLFLNIEQHSTTEFSMHRNRRLFFFFKFSHCTNWAATCLALRNCQVCFWIFGALTTIELCPKNFIPHLWIFAGV